MTPIIYMIEAIFFNQRGYYRQHYLWLVFFLCGKAVDFGAARPSSLSTNTSLPLDRKSTSIDPPDLLPIRNFLRE